MRLAGGTFPEAERLLTGMCAHARAHAHTRPLAPPSARARTSSQRGARARPAAPALFKNKGPHPAHAPLAAPTSNNDAAIAEAAAGRLESALRYIDRAIERDATSARFRVNRADIARRLNDTEAALVDYAAARELCARTSSRRDDELAWEIECKVSLVHYEAGASHFNRTDYPAAFAAFSRALACNPRVPQYLLARAEVATMLKRWDVVRVDAEAALALAPDDAKARAMLSRVVPA